MGIGNLIQLYLYGIGDSQDGSQMPEPNPKPQTTEATKIPLKLKIRFMCNITLQ